MKFLTSLLLFTGVALAHAAPDADNSAPTPTSSAPKPYTDQGTMTYQTTYTPNYADQYYGVNSQFYNNRFDRLNTYTSIVSVQNRPLYYAPNPPALGQTGFKTRERAELGKSAPPVGLASNVYELFYTPLSTLLFVEDLSRKRREKLDAYQAARSTILVELRTKLDELAGADSATRERELTALAQVQATRLASLQAAAEALRENFVEGSFFESSSNWNDSRDWRLGDNTRWESQIDEIKVMRGYSAYQTGLSPEQRRLLREIAMELEDSLAAPTADISLTSQGPYFYFSPDTSRITLPADLPADLSAKLDLYRSTKAELKKELRDTLYANDRALFHSKRVNALKSLAEKQAPRFTELETLAEEIRRGLVPFPNPDRPPVLPLSKEIRARIANYHREKGALQTTLLSKLDEVKTALPNDRVEFARTGENYAVTVIANRRSNAEQAAKREALAPTLATFNQEQGRRYSALAREKTALGKDILAAVSELSGRNTSKSLTQLLQEFSFSLQKQELWELYREYEIAVLEPGLSPEQRRVLFGAAIDKLNLPLNN